MKQQSLFIGIVILELVYFEFSGQQYFFIFFKQHNHQKFSAQRKNALVEDFDKLFNWFCSYRIFTDIVINVIYRL